jgi:electron transport complex protein RnfB
MSQQPPWDINAPAMTAFIREDECIGCTKCLPDCPTDAILGGPKLMHTVITDACTGCELCVPTCPVDCIEMRPTTERTATEKQTTETHWQQRFDHHNQRLSRLEQEKQQQHDQARFKNANDSVEARQSYINSILARKHRN